MRLRLTHSQREHLKHLALKTTDMRIRRRVKALLDIDAGDRPGVVARRYDVARSTIYNWIGRCHRLGFSDQALCDLPRSGRPPRLPKENEKGNNHDAT